MRDIHWRVERLQRGTDSADFARLDTATLATWRRLQRVSMDELYFTVRSAALIVAIGAWAIWLIAVPLAYVFADYATLPAAGTGAQPGFLDVLAGTLKKLFYGVAYLGEPKPDIFYILAFTLFLPAALTARSVWNWRAYFAELARPHPGREFPPE